MDFLPESLDYKIRWIVYGLALVHGVIFIAWLLYTLPSIFKKPRNDISPENINKFIHEMKRKKND
jgi:hypothetical protein